ncbi:toll-like receptor 4 isoform X1 [Argopecten irradians]|uniref:toll-like receptor 4 isoform X1 n=1 Tax=Argopecten irradians TaxID=31199 RepID=UPI00371FA9C6
MLPYKTPQRKQHDANRGRNMATMKFVVVVLAVVMMEAVNGYSGMQNHQHCVSDVRCRCNGSEDTGLVADCSNLNISSIPKFYSNVTKILLQRNNIKHLKIEDRQFPRSVLYLDISENKLETFADDPFRSMDSLVYLDLGNNLLKYMPNVFPRNVFKGLKSLSYLNLQGNNVLNTLHPDNLSYPVSIGDIAMLTTCLLDGVDQTGFPSEFKDLLHLEVLDLGNEAATCELPILRSNYFENVTSVRNLSLSYCQIRFIENGTFLKLTQLYFLNVSNNDRLTFGVMSNLTSDLKALPIHTLDISRIHCDYGPGTSIYVDDVVNLRNHTHLRRLYLNNNRLSLPEFGVISLLPKSLRFISVNGNRLTFGSYVFELAGFINLEYFDGSRQYTSHDPDTGSRDCRDWRAPPTYSNDFQAISSILTNLQDFSSSIQQMSSTKLVATNVSQVSRPNDSLTSTNSIVSSPPTFPVPGNLREVLFFGSVLDYEIRVVPLGPNNLTRVDIHGNLLHSWSGTVLNIDKVKFIDGSNNYCTYISDNFFDHCENLEELLLHDNLLGNVLKTDENGNIFRRLVHLKLLDLSWNRIQEVPNLLLKNQNNLQILNISNNEMLTFDLNFEHMNNLQYLNLSKNRLSLLSKQTRKQIDSCRSHNLTVNLYGNKLQCSCETLDFLKWLGERRNTFDDFHSYECRFPDETTGNFSDFENVLIRLKTSCNKYTGLIVGTTFGVCLAISLTLSGIVYRYRWKIRYLYYMTKTKYRGYSSLVTDYEDRDEYPYDAFVSYCEKDGRFVRGDLLNNLERQNGLTLCLHQRDFIPGHDIAENITKAIHQSRKTIVIVSKSYLKSYWCMYEFNMARMESIYAREGNSVLLLVFYDNVEPTDLPLTLMDLIDSKSYIEYPDDEQGNVVFWGKLAESISM